MKVSQYLVKRLLDYNVTDVFGIPGGVILDFIYELNECKNINVHLNYHEQAAAYAACGYAQSSGRLGVAYATKGPGVTNMITAIAEAYYDSLPVLFITAHSQTNIDRRLRIEEEQEIDHIGLTKTVTKYSKRIDDLDDAIEAINTGCREALSGRKGPVLLDFSLKVLKSEIEDKNEVLVEKNTDINLDKCIEDIKNHLNESKRPVFLIGDGVRLSSTGKDIGKISEKYGIPILSSRFSQDILYGHENYFGYIGSHGLRYSNFILSKVDCIIALGNRMAFQIESKSFKKIIDNSRILRIDVDEMEMLRIIPASSDYCVDLQKLIQRLKKEEILYKNNEWIQVCKKLEENLKNSDVNFGVRMLSKVMNMLGKDDIIVCDIGNNELLTSRAYALCGKGRKLLHSKALKTVGCAIGKAIGAYYANRKRVLCIVGDQGIQFNIQELQFIKNNQLPITIAICNNNASEMLKDNERKQGYSYDLHTTLESGYSHPDFEKVANAYGIKYLLIKELNELEIQLLNDEPQIIELLFDRDSQIEQILPKGYPCQKFVPEIDSDLYDYLDNL